MIDEKDFIVKKYTSKDKTRIQKWFMHYCNSCHKKRNYAPKNVSNLCISCSCKGRSISLEQRKNISNSLKGNTNGSNISKQKIIERTSKRMGITTEQYINEINLRRQQRKVRKNMLDRLSRFLKKIRKTVKYFSFSRDELFRHLESKFQPGMAWENYGRLAGRKSWEVDHIIPLRYKDTNEFYWNQEDLCNPNSETFKMAWGLNNLQPKWDHENWSKGARLKG